MKATRGCSVDGCNREHAARGLCLDHYMQARRQGMTVVRPKGLPLRDRFMQYVIKTPGGCWWWTGAADRRPHIGGYGRFSYPDAESPTGFRQRSSHRMAYELFVGPIPDGMELDHLCRNRRCCNPAHLDPVTNLVNQIRSPYSFIGRNVLVTRCPQGHEYTEANTTINNKGARECKACKARRDRERHARRRRASCS